LKGFDLDPESAFSKTWKAQVYALMGDTAHALSYCERVIATEPHAVHGLWARALAASLRGDMNEARSVLAEREKIVAVDGEQWYNLAQGEALVGSTAKCALALRKAIDGGFFCTPLMRRDVYLDPIRNDPVIRDLLAQAAQKHQEFIRRFNLSDEAR
ncbi:MAG TPA: hypothetical protein VEO56_14695, partial [Bacteroidota bacterium]|nr:hypothetical protein [Bacteroidota bacterium]